jgi:peptide/nickel transport system substrate-binding protein
MIDPARTVAGDHYTYVPNPYYYKKSAIRYSEVDVKIIPQNSSMLQALKTGQIDLAEGDPSTGAAANSAGFNVVATPYETIMLYISDWKGKVTPALADVRVRQAINYAIDRKTISRALFGPYAAPTDVLLTTDATPKKTYYPYNPQKAKALLAAAGYSKGVTIKAFDFAGLGQFGDPLIQAAASDLQKVGINLDVKTAATGGVWVQYLHSKKFPISETGFPFVTTPIMTPTYLLPPGDNFGEYDPVVRKLYYQGLNAANPIPAWKRMWDRVAKQAYFVPLVSQDTLWYVSKHVGGVTSSKARVGMALPQEWYPR